MTAATGALLLAAPTDSVPAADGWLTAAEQERAARFRLAIDRESFVAAHLLVRICAADLLGARPDRLTLIQRCTSCGGPHGRPSLAGHPDLTVTLSHTRGYVAAAAAYGPLGVDLELADGRPLDWTLVSATFSPADAAEVAADADPLRAFLRRWVRRECLVKVGAAALGVPGADATGWAVLDWTDPTGSVVGAVVTAPGTPVTLRAAARV